MKFAWTKLVLFINIGSSYVKHKTKQGQVLVLPKPDIHGNKVEGTTFKLTPFANCTTIFINKSEDYLIAELNNSEKVGFKIRKLIVCSWDGRSIPRINLGKKEDLNWSITESNLLGR